MRDWISLIGLDVGFAVLITVHLTIVYGLVVRSPRWRALAALVLPPLAPYWAVRGGMRGRGVLWLTAVGLYLGSFVLAYAGG